MKLITVLVTLLMSTSLIAMPEYLKGAIVTVALKDGTVYQYKSEDKAVVDRNSMNKRSEEVKTAKTIIKKVEERKLTPNKKNRVYVLGGYGNTGDLNSSTNGSQYKVEHEQGFVGGVGYQRKVGDDDLNVGAQVQTDGSASLSLGVDF